MKTNRNKKPNLTDMVKAARDAGMEVSFSLEQKMPMRFPSDPPMVTALLNESVLCNALGNRWSADKVPNPIAAQKCFEMGWAHALSAAVMRCQYNGDLKRAQDDFEQKHAKHMHNWDYFLMDVATIGKLISRDVPAPKVLRPFFDEYFTPAETWQTLLELKKKKPQKAKS